MDSLYFDPLWVSVFTEKEASLVDLGQRSSRWPETTQIGNTNWGNGAWGTGNEERNVVGLWPGEGMVKEQGWIWSKYTLYMHNSKTTHL